MSEKEEKRRQTIMESETKTDIKKIKLDRKRQVEENKE